MFRKWLTALGAPVLAVAALTFSGGPALAGHGGGHGGGGHGGFHGGGFHGAGFRGGGFRGAGFRGAGFRGAGFRGNGFGRGWGGWGGWGWGYPWYGNYPSYYYTYPSVDYVYPYSYGFVPSAADYSANYYSPDSAAAPVSNTVQLNVQVPANAQLWIDGYKTTQTGTMRHYTSPPLTPGMNYSYDIRARWMENGKPVERDKKVSFHAGESIDMNLMDGSASH